MIYTKKKQYSKMSIIPTSTATTSCIYYQIKETKNILTRTTKLVEDLA